MVLTFVGVPHGMYNCLSPVPESFFACQPEGPPDCVHQERIDGGFHPFLQLAFEAFRADVLTFGPKSING